MRVPTSLNSPAQSRAFVVVSSIVTQLALSSTVLAEIDFNRDVRPILSDRCFACHGPDATTREADLRLDVRDGAMSDLGGYSAVTPRDVDASELVARITSGDHDLVMPPPEYNKPLTAGEVDLLKQWIAEGAVYEEHWSFRPLRRPDVPVVSEDVDNAIDAFVLQGIVDADIRPNGRADARTLARRVTFDLIGLPSEPDRIEQFVSDSSDESYAALVDELLASPHFGERMAMYWLDLVRYADTLGYHGDQVRSVSPYRDYVIKAFNENKPYDEFTIEQLAGDLLPDATVWQRVASTYNRLNRASGEGGVQPKEYLAKYSADRVRTLGSVWLGATVGCAECHDHKFDPFTTRDFYNIAAFFADIKEQGIVRSAKHIAILPVPTPEQAAEQSRIRSELELARTEYRGISPQFEAARQEWVKSLATSAERWTVLKPVARSVNGTKLTVDNDGLVKASGKNPGKDTYHLTLDSLERPPGAQVGSIALRLEVLAADDLPAKGPGRASNGNFVVNRVEVKLNGHAVEWRAANATHYQKPHLPENFVKKNDVGWAILPKAGQSHELILVGDVPTEPTAADSVESPAFEVSIVQNHGNGHTLGRLRVSIAWSDDVGLSATLDPDLVAFSRIPEGDRTTEQAQKLDESFRNTTPLLSEVRDRITALEKQQKALDAGIVTTLATEATTPREIRVLPRGNWMDDSGEVCEPAVPAFLSVEIKTDRERLNRLDLAKWLVSAENPMTARAFVNRLWMLFFGQGLARNVDDLGSQGDVPTHPELLDWLAVEFIESGWDIKHLVKLIVLSDTYQRSSRVTEEMSQRDPLNRAYARQSRHRLEAEMVRDNALAVSGLLVKTIGGKSVMPYQPAGYWGQLNFPKRKYRQDAGDAQYRRGLYTHWQRTFLHPSLMAFDAPAREECTAQRTRSNTPLQSLVLLNDPTFVEAARVLAQRVLLEAEGSVEQRLDWLYREVLAREIRDDERPLLNRLYEQNRAAFAEDKTSVDKLLGVGLAPVAEGIHRVELATWTSVTRAVLNLHETITRY